MNISAEGLLTLKRNRVRDSLKREIINTIECLKLDLNKLEKGLDVNDLGIVQSKGLSIDLLCKELGTLEQAIEMVKGEHVLQK